MKGLKSLKHLTTGRLLIVFARYGFDCEAARLVVAKQTAGVKVDSATHVIAIKLRYFQQ